jgi:hypothetical protein
MKTKPTTISNDRMAAFIETILIQARDLLTKRADDMLDSWHTNIQEREDNDESFPPLKLSISASVDLENAAIETGLVFASRYKSTVSSPLPDPDQMELPMGGGE